MTVPMIVLAVGSGIVSRTKSSWRIFIKTDSAYVLRTRGPAFLR